MSMCDYPKDNLTFLAGFFVSTYSVRILCISADHSDMKIQSKNGI